MTAPLPPHEPEAEAGALACVLIADRPEALLAQLDESDLYDHRHLTIFRALLSLENDARPISSVSVYQELKDRGQLKEAGGLDYVTRLPDGEPSALNFQTYLRTVKDRSLRRQELRKYESDRCRLLDLTIPVVASTQNPEALLESRQFNYDITPPPLRAIYTLAGQPICTPGNIATITSAVKTGKSAVIGAMAASAMAGENPVDLLGFWSENRKGYALNWFDSEQAPDDFWNCVARAIKRAGLTSPPPWLHAYCLTGLGYKRARECVQTAVKIGADEHGGTHSILLDGAADLIGDVNDAEESNGFVAEVHGMAIANDCPIASVIHFNPGSDKSRGHLGSQLERKAETNLALEKDSSEATVIYSTKNRRAGIPKDRGPRFKFDVDAGMHVTVATRGESKDEAERERLMDLAEDLFSEHRGMRYGDLITTVQKRLTVSERTAEKKVARMKALTVIVKSVGGFYASNRPISV